MDWSLVFANLANPPVLFFFLGMAAAALRSDLDVPQPLPKLFSLYLLVAIGLKGGAGLAESGGSSHAVLTLAAACAIALLVPCLAFAVARLKLDVPNSAAIAATYGSVSAVTFIAASSFLSKLHVPYGGYMVAALALMESPAIIAGIAFAKLWGGPAPAGGRRRAQVDWSHVLREAFLNGSVFVLVGSLLIGAVTGKQGRADLAPFTEGIFRGMLCLFLLDMGLVSARRFTAIRRLGLFCVAFATLLPAANGAIGIACSRLIGLGAGDALLFTILCASASYIAVPAAVRMAIPEADPGIYVPMALAITFPFNIVVGIPLYLSVINMLWK